MPTPSSIKPTRRHSLRDRKVPHPERNELRIAVVELDWIDVAALADLPVDDVVGAKAGEREVALYLFDGEVFATDNMCTHGNARLCDGFLEDGKIECPLHQGLFDVRTGKALCAPLTKDLRVIPARIVDGRVQVQIEG